MDSAAIKIDRRDRLAGTLLGTALGDALGLPAEGMTARAIARRFGRVDRFRLLGSVGFVSDDTEQTALVAEALAVAPRDLDHAIWYFQRQFLRWFLRGPWGIGRATLRSGLRLALGFIASGVRSAGNGAAMRSAVVGVFFAADEGRRRDWARLFALTTHTDPRAVRGAVYVAEVAGLAAQSQPDADRFAIIAQARDTIDQPAIAEAIDQAGELARQGATAEEAATVCGRSGYVVHTVALATFLFLRFGDDPMTAWAEGISVGGDTDSVAAIVGAWMGALHGESGLPAELIDRLHDGPYGPTHLRRLADALAAASTGAAQPAPRYSRVGAMARNLALWPVILGHGLRRLVPF